MDALGTQKSYDKVDNASVIAPIVIRIPIPSEYTNNASLKAAYVGDNGVVTYLPTTIVAIDKIKYLQFETTHFSLYAVTAAKPSDSSLDKVPKTGDQNLWLRYTFLWHYSCRAYCAGVFDW
jgi:hypothetical protein